MRFALLFATAALCGVAAAGPSYGLRGAAPMETYGSLRATVTENAMAKLAATLLDVINKDFKDINLPDIHIDTHVPVLGHITVDLTAIAIQDFHIDAATVKTAAPADLTAALDDIGVDINMDFKYRKVHWPHLSSSGRITISPQDATIGLGLQGNVVDSHPQLSAISTDVTLGSFKIDFHGSLLDWLYDLLVDLLKKSLEKDIETAIGSALDKAVDDTINGLLSKIPTSLHVGGGLSEAGINATVTHITATSTYLTTGDMFAVKNFRTGMPCPVPSFPLPPTAPGATTDEVQIMISDTPLSCFAWVATTNGALNVTASGLSPPKGFPLPLTTTGWKTWVPALYTKFGAKPLSLGIGPSVPITFTTSVADGVTATGAFDMDIAVFESDSSATFAVTLGVSMDFGVDVAFNDSAHRLDLRLSSLKLDISVVKSAIGTVSAAPLQILLGVLLPIARDAINAALAEGIPLPSIGGVSLVDPKVSYQDHYFAIASSFTANLTAVAV